MHYPISLRRLIVIATMAAGVFLTTTGVETSKQTDLWMAPRAEAVTARAGLARAVADLAAGKVEDAFPAFQAAVTDPVLGPYARLFVARAYLAASRPADVGRTVAAIMAGAPSDALAESALNLAVEAAAAVPDTRALFSALQQLTTRPTSQPAVNEFRLLQAAITAGDRPSANASFLKLYFDYAAAPETSDAIEEMERIKVSKPAPTREDLARHLGRAEALFSAGKYTDARALFVALQPLASGETKELTQLRVAECDLFLKKYLVASTALRSYGDKAATRTAEAEYHYFAALKGLGRTAEYVSGVREFSTKNETSWAERALNDLGTFHILADEDEKAAAVFADLYARFPQGAFADRAAWRSGWWAYKQGQFAETVRIFDAAASSMRRADYRPAWMYWAAKAHLELGHRDAAAAGFRRVIADYRNSYYGRAAQREFERLPAVLRTAAGPASTPRTLVTPAPRPANADLIEQLLAAGMYDDAIAELRRLQATGNGSPLVDATLAYAFNRQGKLRSAITAMRRAYPQFMAEGGEALPQEILTVIFPIDHWKLLQASAAEKNLDVYLLAALVAQESTFQADIRSAANAWGLMQIVPATGRRYAASLGIRPFSTFRLTEPEVNVKIGTSYFSDLLKRFGDVAPALAAYNAGEQRVVKWLAERHGFERDEFIDDIPFPETQNYVKRIIGTAEDYRVLYGR